MYEVTLSTDRWHNRVISPVPFCADARGLQTVLVHPGWGKRPEMHNQLLQEIAEVGYRPIGVDTRYGYADQDDHSLRMRVGSDNPYFDIESPADNRYFYRRPTGLLRLCEQLDIEQAHYVGHSEGVRVGLVTATADRLPVEFGKMVLVNGVGTGKAGGFIDMLRANKQAIADRGSSEASVAEAIRSFGDSVVHGITHPRRMYKEARNIQGYDAWPDIGKLAVIPGLVTVIQARDDHLIAYEDAAENAKKYPNITFITTDGSHSNVYEKPVRTVITDQLVS